MNTEEILKELKIIYGEHLMDEENIDIDQIDSFEFIQTILTLEDTFEIEIGDEMLDFNSFKNLNEIAIFIKRNMEEKSWI